MKLCNFKRYQEVVCCQKKIDRLHVLHARMYNVDITDFRAWSFNYRQPNISKEKVSLHFL